MSDSGKVPGKVPDSGEMSDSGVRFLRHFSQRLTRDGGQGSLFPQILARALFSATSVCTYPGVPLHVHPVYTRPGCPWPVLPVLTCVRCYFRSSSGRIRWFPIPLFRAPPDARHLSVRRSTWPNNLCVPGKTRKACQNWEIPLPEKSELLEIKSLFGPRRRHLTEPGRECWWDRNLTFLVRNHFSSENVFQATGTLFSWLNAG